MCQRTFRRLIPADGLNILIFLKEHIFNTMGQASSGVWKLYFKRAGFVQARIFSAFQYPLTTGGGGELTPFADKEEKQSYSANITLFLISFIIPHKITFLWFWK